MNLFKEKRRQNKGEHKNKDRECERGRQKERGRKKDKRREGSWRITHSTAILPFYEKADKDRIKHVKGVVWYILSIVQCPIPLILDK